MAWFHCFAGIAGDMALGSLVDVGADLDEITAMLDRIPMSGWSIEAEPVLRGGVAATKIHVIATEDGVVRTHAHIAALIEEARLPDRARDRALATFAGLAEVEGRLHRRPPGQVHFHEVGGIDAIVDIVGACAALEILGVDEVHSSPVTTGRGMIRSAHGLLPNPAPAVVALLARANAPTVGRDVSAELTTPTGAALLAALATSWGPLPPMRITATGFGAGTRDFADMPNATQVVLGTAIPAISEDELENSGQPVTLLEANVDDVTGETIAYAISALLDGGAHDAWVTPIIMKKGRPAFKVSALCDAALVDQVTRVLVAETGTLGVRGQQLRRWPEPRTFDEVEVGGVPVRVKVSPGRVKVEHDDAARAARHIGAPLREVVWAAEDSARRARGPTELGPPGPDPDDGEAG